MHDIGDTMLRVGLFNPVVDVDRMQLTYADVMGLMRDLKTLGAHNVTETRQRGLTGKGRLRAMCQAYETYRVAGRLPASYEVVYGHAWAPRQRTQDGVTCIPLDGLRLGG
jgi:malonyl-CoA O-methyltransferase